MTPPPIAVFSPALAAGTAVAAVGVPVLIHLLFRKRYQVLPWAAIRFLLAAERRHRRRIDQWLLLALRALALLLPLFAMIAATGWAEPLWQAIRPGATETVANVPRTHHVLVLDASLSMTAAEDGKPQDGADGRSRFAAALAQAENLVQSGSPGDGYSLIVIAGGTQLVIPGPANDKGKVVDELRKVKPTHAPADTAAAVASVADALARSPRAYPRRQVTFFTDLQRSAWANVLPKPDSPPPDAWQRVFGRPDVDVVVLDTGRPDADANLAVTGLALVDPLPMVDSPVAVTAVVGNFGREPQTDVVLQLVLARPSSGAAGEHPVDQRKVGVIPPGTRVTVSFGGDGLTRYREKGLHVVGVKLSAADGRGVDALPADNSRYLAFEVRDGLHALLVDGKPDPTPLRRGAEFLFRALSPPGARPSDTPARPRLITPAEFADPLAADLSGVDCVYLADVRAPTAELASKLDAVLRRGGGVVIGLGPNAAADKAAYNRHLFNDGDGVLPGPLGDVVTVAGPDDPGFRLSADEDAYRRPPLELFQNEKIRGGLIMAPFRTYLRLDAPPDGRARRVLSFVPARPPGAEAGVPAARKPDPALVEWNRQRGRVVVFTSTFNEDWNDWPPLPSYLMFHHELLRFAAASPDRHTVGVGDPVEEFYPPALAGRTAEVTGPGVNAQVVLAAQDGAAVARLPNTRLGGLYKVRLDGATDRVFAVNAPEAAAGAGSEFDLKRIDPNDLRALGTVQVVTDGNDVKPTAESGAEVVSAPKPHGPAIARFAIMVTLGVLALEMLLAWRWGPARAAAGAVRPVDRKWYLRVLSTAGALVPLAAAVAALAVLVHYERTGNLLGFLPDGPRHRIEAAAGVPAAQPGEGTRWRLEGFTAFVRNAVTDRRMVLALAAGCVGLAVFLYRLERKAVAGARRLFVPVLLRVAVLLIALFVLLPQLRLAFDREGWPEVVILIDTSGSMGRVDDFKDPAVRAKAEQLAGVPGLTQANRLELARLLLTRKDADWLDRLVTEKQVKVHVYAVDEKKPRPVATAEDPADAPAARTAIERLVRNEKGELQPLGAESRLGEGVEDILKTFRGGSLAAIIMFTDGVTTAGDNLPTAAREAARAGVPLFLVGVGDAWDTPDLILTDLQAEDTITVGDRLVFDARLAARGQVPPDPLPVVLYEKVNGQLVERGRQVVTPDLAGNRVPVTVPHTPTDPGEKTYVLEVPTVAGEADRTNNRLERTVLVTDSRRVRVLYVEGYPRYDFRFAKVLLERESERSAGGKGVEVEVVLLDASKGWPETDRSAFRGDFPTRDQLFAYDVVVLGDVDPKQFPRGNRTLQDLADFVRVKGGGVMFLSGEHGTPAAFAETPLADVLPVLPADPGPARNPEAASLTEGYRPRLTPSGRQHPLFRFSPDDAEATAIWNRLPPLYWYAKGYRRKPGTVVLAVHPDRPAEGTTGNESHPLVIQQFVGAGSVLFLGFDDTWRWRYRNDEEQFDRFWVQAVRVLSRSRVRRVELKVLPKPEFRRDEKMTVAVRFPVESPGPAAGAPVRVTLVRGPLPNPDGSPGSGPTETATLTLAQSPGPGAQYETTLTRTPEGEYRFTLTDPEPQPGLSPAAAVARVYPPLNELDRVELNKPDLAAAAALSSGGFYTLATADKVFDDLKNLQRVPLNQPCPPVEIWNSPWVYLLVLLLLASEWLLRKRERLL